MLMLEIPYGTTIRRFCALSGVCLGILLGFCLQASAEVTVVRSAMYSEQPFVKAQSLFSLYDTFYCVFDVAGLEIGSHTMRADWITPTGSLEHQSEYAFVHKKPVAQHRLYSWLKVWRNGPITRIMTGREYKNKFYGLWHVRIYIDGNLLARQEFEAL